MSATTQPGRTRALLGPYRVLRGNRGLGLLFAGQVVSAVGDRLYIVVALVLAYNLTHSAVVVALLNLMRVLPSALCLPLAGAWADRVDRKALMVTADLGRAVCMLGLLAVRSPASLWLAFVLIFATTGLLGLFRPALNATVPALVADDSLLAPANALMTQIDALAFVVGPALGGVLLLVGQPQLAFVLNALTYLISAATLLALDIPPRPAARPAEGTGWLAETLAGFRFLFRENEGALAGVSVPLAGYQVYDGASWALLIALSVQAWHLGSAGAGFINTAYGVGGLVAGFAVGALTRRTRPEAGFAGAIAARSALVLLLGLSPPGVWPFLALGAMGLADVLTLICAVTLIQSATPPELLGRGFAAFESSMLAAKGVGAVVAGPLIAAVGARATTAGCALLTLLLLLLCVSRLRRVRRVLGVRAFLRRVPALAPLSRVALDEVARLLRLESVPAGAEIVHEGERGEAMYFLKSGEVDVLAGAASGRSVPVARLAAPDYFGELALLRDAPRTATVRARGPVELYSLTRAQFEAVMARSAAVQATLSRTGEARYTELQTLLLLTR